MDKFEILTWLARGFNPFTGEKCKDDEVLRNPDVVSALYEIILELGQPPKKQKKNFKYDPALGDLIKILEPSTIKPIAKNIEEVIGLGYTIIQKAIQEYLILNGLLEIRPDINDSDKPKKFATSLGEGKGILNDTYSNQYGKTYHRVIYTIAAQKYIISQLSNILDFNNENGTK